MHQIRNGMQSAGFNDVATSIALTSLTRKGYVKSESVQNFNEELYAYRLTPQGEEWLLANHEKLELRVQGNTLTEDDILF